MFNHGETGEVIGDLKASKWSEKMALKLKDYLRRAFNMPSDREGAFTENPPVRLISCIEENPFYKILHDPALDATEKTVVIEQRLRTVQSSIYEFGGLLAYLNQVRLNNFQDAQELTCRLKMLADEAKPEPLAALKEEMARAIVRNTALSDCYNTLSLAFLHDKRLGNALANTAHHLREMNDEFKATCAQVTVKIDNLKSVGAVVRHNGSKTWGL